MTEQPVVEAAKAETEVVQPAVYGTVSAAVEAQPPPSDSVAESE